MKRTEGAACGLFKVLWGVLCCVTKHPDFCFRYHFSFFVNNEKKKKGAPPSSSVISFVNAVAEQYAHLFLIQYIDAARVPLPSRRQTVRIGAPIVAGATDRSKGGKGPGRTSSASHLEAAALSVLS